MIYIVGLLLLSFSYIEAQNTITVIGIGRLGICTALCFEKAGYRVIGVDINPAYIESINNKTFSSPEPYLDEFLQESSNFKATCSLDEGLEASDIYYIMVDTPSTASAEAYDHSKLSKVLSEVNKRKLRNKHVVIGCTVFPGYIRTIGKFLLQDCVDTTLSYNPEFIAQGAIMQGFRNPDIILIGEGSPVIGDRLEELYRNVCTNNPTVCRMSPDSAEITKLAVNCFVTTKIAYANMIGDIADQTPHADKFAILQAVGNDKRIGSLYLKPGYGFGGPCFPRDNRALGSYAQEVGIEPIIPNATDTANKLHTQHMIEQLLDESLQEYIFQGVTYKENCTVPIIEESQKLIIAVALAKQGKRVTIIDTAEVITQVQQTFGNIFEYRIIEL
jgi:nucleotide sugar dehydrogenase